MLKKNLLLITIRIILSYIFLVAAIYAALALDSDHIIRAVIISVAWLSLSALDEIIYWKLITKMGDKK